MKKIKKFVNIAFLLVFFVLSGTVSASSMESDVVFTLKAAPKPTISKVIDKVFPKTGEEFALSFLLIGLVLIAVALYMMYKKNKKDGRVS